MSFCSVTVAYRSSDQFTPLSQPYTEEVATVMAVISRDSVRTATKSFDEPCRLR